MIEPASCAQQLQRLQVPGLLTNPASSLIQEVNIGCNVLPIEALELPSMCRGPLQTKRGELARTHAQDKGPLHPVQAMDRTGSAKLRCG